MQFSTLCAVFLVVVLSVCCINAQDPVIAYAGSTDGQATFFPPYGGSSSSACAPYSSDYAFAAFNVTFPVSGLREVAVLSNYGTYVYIYVNTFNPSMPCVNSLGGDQIEDNGFSSELDVDAVVWFNASTVYVIVVAGEPNTDYLDDPDWFAINIFPSNYNGNTFTSTEYWSGVEDTQDDDSTCTAEDSEADLPYGNYTWTQTESGWFDISVMFWNATSSTYIIAALYNTTAINVTADPCQYGFVTAANDDYYGTVMYYVWLNQSVTYSVIVSSDYTDETGYFAVAVRSTLVRFPNLDGWNQPDREYDQACSADDSDTDCAWDAIVFQPNGLVTLFDTADAPYRFSSFDTYSFLYSGDNSHGALGGSPTTCPIIGSLLTGRDTGSYRISYQTNINNTYTVVVSTYYGSAADAGDAYIYYLFTGLPLGYSGATVSTSATATTGSNPTTGNPNPTTGSNPTTGNPNPTTGTNPTTGVTIPPTVTPTRAPTNGTTPPTAVPTRRVNVTSTTTTSGASAVAATLVMAAVVAAGIQLF